MKVAACYLRVSTELQTVENQRAPLEQLARQRGYAVKFYEETGSAVKHRPVFEQMMADAHAGKLGAVVVAAIDRLGRRMVDVVATVAQLTQKNVVVISVREPWVEVGGPARELLVAVMGWVAEYERSTLVERTKAGLVRARKQGKTLGRPKANAANLAAAVLLVKSGASAPTAARRCGVGASTLRRELERQGYRAGHGHKPRGEPVTDAWQSPASHQKG